MHWSTHPQQWAEVDSFKGLVHGKALKRHGSRQLQDPIAVGEQRSHQEPASMHTRQV